LEGGVEVDGETYELTNEMVRYEAEPPEHVSAAEFDGGTVYVDTELTDDIEAEGYARDVVRRIQEMRKRLDLDVESEIHTAVDVADDRVAEFVDRHREYVATETRSRELGDGAPENGEFELIEEWDVEGVAVTIGVDPVGA
jgi:isoleucyl-tRNA synthetase